MTTELIETFSIIDRPPINRRRLGDIELEEMDSELEKALLATLGTGKAIRVPLWRFHSSPAKGRIWKRGLSVRHRVLPDRRSVAAWVEEVRVEGTTE
jgi:hypothetical protein